MRQFITMRFWMSLLAVLALFGLVYVATRGEPDSDNVIAAENGPVERHVDFAARVYSVNGDAGFTMVRGKANGQLQLVIDGSRTMVVQPDTPGEITCTKLADIGACVVVADLLGDAVLWFALVPYEDQPSITLPGIATLQDQNIVELTNGWVLPRAASVDLDCADDVGSLTEFVRRFGPSSTTTFNLDSQRIVRATCTQAPQSTTTTTVPATPPPQQVVPGETLPPDETVPDASSSGIG